MLPDNSLRFMVNNVEGIHSSKKTLKLIQDFKDKEGSTGKLFLQEAHCNSRAEQNWKDNFNGQIIFYHGKQILVVS